MSLSRLKESVKELVNRFLEEESEELYAQKPFAFASAKPSSSDRWYTAKKRIFMCDSVLQLFRTDDHIGHHAFDVLRRYSAVMPTYSVSQQDGFTENLNAVGNTRLVTEEFKYTEQPDLSDRDLRSLILALRDQVNDDASDSYTLRDQLAQEMADSIYQQMQARCLSAAKSFTQSFIETFCDKYIKPLLINKGLYHETSAQLVEGFKAVSIGMLTQSYMRTALSVFIRQSLHTLLTACNMDANEVEDVTSRLVTVIAMTNDPLNVIELGINGTSAEAGQFAAYELIHRLPKLKHEPEIVERQQQEEYPVQSGLRLRFA